MLLICTTNVDVMFISVILSMFMFMLILKLKISHLIPCSSASCKAKQPPLLAQHNSLINRCNFQFQFTSCFLSLTTFERTPKISFHAHLLRSSGINFFRKFSLSRISHAFFPSRVLEDASQAEEKQHSSQKDSPKGKEGGEGGEGGGYSPCLSYHTLNPSPLRHNAPPDAAGMPSHLVVQRARTDTELTEEGRARDKSTSVPPGNRLFWKACRIPSRRILCLTSSFSL